ncbi:MAG: hypothetical protein R2729_00255 [Bryobacteraceae bacterium]
MAAITTAAGTSNPITVQDTVPGELLVVGGSQFLVTLPECLFHD